MVARVVHFPDKSILRAYEAVRDAHAPVGERLSAGLVLVSGITHQKPVPPETIPVLLDTARDLAGTEESLELSFALSKVRDWRILGAALVLLEHPRQSPLHWVGRMLAGDYREEEV